LLAGAGAVEIELARRVKSIGEKREGLDQYSIQQFANALETLPKLLAENAGFKVNFYGLIVNCVFNLAD
jgi:T-complex protein 1 subunit theta